MDKREINLSDILSLLKKRWWFVLLIALLVAGGVGAYRWFTYEPVYTSAVTVYVDADSTSQQSSANEDVSEVTWALKVIKNYMEILKTSDFLEDVSETYQQRFPEAWAQQPYTVTRLSNCMTFSATDETYLFTVTIQTKAKEDSYNLGVIFEELAPQKILEITGKDSIKIADSARLATYASNPRNMARNTALGFVIGAVLAFLIVFIIDISDVRIKKEEDILNNYPFPLLGSVPCFDMATKKKKKGYGYGKE